MLVASLTTVEHSIKDLKNQPFSIRPATDEDLLKIVAIEQKFYPMPWTEAQFASELEKSFSSFLVMTDDETDEVVAGYCVFWGMDESIELLNITVDEGFRGRGFAKRFLQVLIADGIKSSKKEVFLEVRKSNTSAIQLYQKTGFEITKVRPRFYSNGEDAYQMKLNLEQTKEWTLKKMDRGDLQAPSEEEFDS